MDDDVGGHPYHLAEVVRSKPRRPSYVGKHLIPPFGAYSHTLPQGVASLVWLLVNPLFCLINTSPNESLVGTPVDPSLGGVGGQKSRIFLFLVATCHFCNSRTYLCTAVTAISIHDIWDDFARSVHAVEKILLPSGEHLEEGSY